MSFSTELLAALGQVRTRRQLVKAKQAARDKEVYGYRNEIRARRPKLLAASIAVREKRDAAPVASSPPVLLRTRRNARGVRAIVPVRAKRHVQAFESALASKG